MSNIIDKVIKSELQITSEYIEKGIGYYHNIYSHNLWTSDNLNIDDPEENFILWSTPSHIGIETYIYNIQEEIFFEISPIYKWNSDYPDDEDEYKTFKEFINRHYPIEIIEVTSKTAPKGAQILHEASVRVNGGNYVRFNDGSLLKLPEDLITRIIRRD